MITVRDHAYTWDEASRLIDAFDLLNAECCGMSDGICDACEYKTLCRDLRAAEQYLIDRLKQGVYGGKKRVHRALNPRDS